MEDPRLKFAIHQSEVVRPLNEGGLVDARGLRDGSLSVADHLISLAFEGRVYIASDADQNDTVTGQTSFANTTPTFLLDVPDGTTAIPLFTNLVQTGTVAGGDIDLLFEIDNIVRFSSGGTAEKVRSSRTDSPIPSVSTLYSGATADAGYGIRIFGIDLGADVSPAEGAANGVFWRPEVLYLLVGPASFAIYSSAATTGPTWFWSIGWAEIPSSGV